MKKQVICILLLAALTEGLTRGQIPSDDMSSTLNQLFGRLRSVSEDSVRLRINDSIRSVVESYAASDKVFKHTFSKLRYLGQITSPDSLIKIISWNLVLANKTGKYFCYFIRRASAGDSNIVYFLTHDYDDKQILGDTIYTQSDWYGALYYDIRPFTAENRHSWVLLGINYSDPMMTRKVIDVLSFTPEGKIIFGRKWFDSGGSINFRHILEYSSSATISLRFSSDSSIVFDHLVPMPPSGDDNRLYNGPDYSYDAYIFEEGVWTLSLNIDARNPKQ